MTAFADGLVTTDVEQFAGHPYGGGTIPPGYELVNVTNLGVTVPGLITPEVFRKRDVDRDGKEVLRKFRDAPSSV